VRGNPGDLPAAGVCYRCLIQGSEDDQIPPELPDRWAEDGRRRQGRLLWTVTIIPLADHFDVVDPQSKAWGIVQTAVLKMVHG